MTHADFLHAICLHPEDDTPRLLYADWLEEQGDPRGEFIRVQIELARGDVSHCVRCGRPWTPVKRSSFPVRTSLCTHCSVEGPLFDDVLRSRALKMRERELLATHGRNWIADPWSYPYHGLDSLPPFRRGFVDEIHCTQETFLRHAEALFKAHPITKVVLEDREPEKMDHSRGITYDWNADYARLGYQKSADLPLSLFSLLEGYSWKLSMNGLRDHHRDFCEYRTQQAALDALSAACVKYGISTRPNTKTTT